MTFRVVASFPYFTLIPEDVVVNTWHFAFVSGSPAEGDFGNLRDDLAAFYEAIYQTVGGHGAAPWLRPLQNTLTIYDLDDSPPRAPVYEGGMALTLGTPPTSSTTPTETAICLSYQADGLSGIPQARRRGRIFLGGLNTAVAAGSASSFPLINSGGRGIVATAAETLMNAVAADGWIWQVHSRTTAGDASVTNGWVDDEPDTQRRRGRRPAVRTVWP